MTPPTCPCYAICMPARVAAIYRYPVKGLGAEPLQSVALSHGRALPDDRRWALARGTVGVEPPAPGWAPKGAFVQCHNAPAMASISTGYEPTTTMIRLTAPDGSEVRGRLDTPSDHAALTAFLQAHAGAAARGTLRIIEAMDNQGGHIAFTDTHEPLVSILGLASVRGLESAVGVPVDARRFRANLWVDGLAAWHEFDWEGRTLRIGNAALRVVAPITRCAAIEAGTTGRRDLPLLAALERLLGHQDCGVYAQVIEPGDIRVGQEVLRT